MERSDVRGWISAILIISAGAGERLFPDFSSTTAATVACGSKRVRRKGK